MAVVCARFCIHGRVQGVFFRASTRTQALQLGLTGYAKNLADGSVEVIACGDATAVDALHRWLHDGPPSTRVDRVECAETPPHAAEGFLTF
ncbi:acylphosphatase [Pseudolysobacter antarcticus]